jgi:hypothetical protein
MFYNSEFQNIHTCFLCQFIKYSFNGYVNTKMMKACIFYGIKKTTVVFFDLDYQVCIIFGDFNKSRLLIGSK